MVVFEAAPAAAGGSGLLLHEGERGLPLQASGAIWAGHACDTVGMRWGAFGRGTWVPFVIAAGALGAALAGGCSLAGEMSGARRIDASPMRVDGVVERVVPVKGGATITVSHQVGGQRFATEGLPVGRVAGLTYPTVGTGLCLEASTEHPKTVRLCGQRYPGGDDMISTEVLIVVAGSAGTLMAAGWIRMVARQKRRDDRGSSSAGHAT